MIIHFKTLNIQVLEAHIYFSGMPENYFNFFNLSHEDEQVGGVTLDIWVFVKFLKYVLNLSYLRNLLNFKDCLYNKLYNKICEKCIDKIIMWCSGHFSSVVFVGYQLPEVCTTGQARLCFGRSGTASYAPTWVIYCKFTTFVVQRTSLNSW